MPNILIIKTMASVNYCDSYFKAFKPYENELTLMSLR